MSENNIYGLDIGGYRTVVTMMNDRMNQKIVENELGEKYVSSGVIFLDGNIGRRMIGSKAFDPSRRDIKNSIRSVKDLFCKSYGLVTESGKLKYIENIPLKNENDGMIYKIGEYELSIEEIYYMLLEKVKEIINSKSSNPIPIILSIPNSYGELEKGILHLLCNHLNINIYSFLPENVSISLSYGYENNEMMKSKNEVKYLLIVDMGYTNCNCTITKYESDKCEIISNENDEELNGRIIDTLLVEKCKVEMKKQYPDVEFTDYLISKIYKNIIKCKEKLSASGADSINLSVDITEDDSFEAELSVDDINNVIIQNGLKNRFINLLNNVCNNPKIDENVKKNLSIIPVGGSMRIPLFLNELEIFLKETIRSNCSLLRTLNMDECVANGCSYYGAILNGWWKYEIVNYKSNNKAIDYKNQSKIITIFNNMCKTMININNDDKMILLKDFIVNNLSYIEYMNCFKNNIKRSVLFEKARFVSQIYRYFSSCIRKEETDVDFDFVGGVIEEMINKTESHSELNKDLSNLRKLLEKLNEETIESNESLIVEYMKSMSKISNVIDKLDIEPNHLKFFHLYKKYNGYEIKNIPYDYSNALSTISQEISKEVKSLTDISKAKNDYEAQYFQYVRVINTLLENGFTPITIDQDSEYYLTGNDIHVLKGVYPNIPVDYKIEDKVVLNSVEEYEEMKKHLIGICDSVEKYNDLNTIIKMQIMNNFSNLVTNMKNSFKEKQSSTKHNRSSKRNTLTSISLSFEMVLNELKTMDKEYSKEVAKKFIEKLKNKYKDKDKDILKKLNGAIKALEDRCESEDTPLYQCDFIKIEKEINEKIHEIKKHKSTIKKVAKYKIGQTVYLSSYYCYGVIVNITDNEYYDVYLFSCCRKETNVPEDSITEKNEISEIGFINFINEDGSYNITYLNGEYDFNIPKSKIEFYKEEEGDDVLDKIILKQKNFVDHSYEVGEVVGLNSFAYYVVRIESKSKVTISDNDTCVITDVVSSDLNYYKDYKRKESSEFNIGDRVEVKRNCINFHSHCIVNYEDAGLCSDGEIISFDLRTNRFKYKMKYNKKIGGKNISVKGYHDYIMNEAVLVPLNDKKKYAIGSIKGLKDDKYTIEYFANDELIEKKFTMSEIKPIQHRNSYEVLNKVIVSFDEITYPGVVISVNNNNEEAKYSVMLSNNQRVNNVSSDQLSHFKFYKDTEVFCICNNNQIVKGKISSLEESGKFTLSSDNIQYSGLDASMIHVYRDYNISSESNVYHLFEGGFSKGNVIGHSANGDYCILFDDNSYYEHLAQAFTFPYYSDYNLYEVGDRIINVKNGNRKGMINEMNIDGSYNILYDKESNDKVGDVVYEMKVDKSDLLRDFESCKTKFLVGDDVRYTKKNNKKDKKDKTHKCRIVRINYFNHTYNIKSSKGKYYYYISDDELTLRKSNNVFSLGEKVKYRGKGVEYNGIIHSIVEDKVILRCEKDEKVMYVANISLTDIERSTIYTENQTVKISLLTDGKREWKIGTIHEYDRINNCYTVRIGTALRYNVQPNDIGFVDINKITPPPIPDSDEESDDENEKKKKNKLPPPPPPRRISSVSQQKSDNEVDGNKKEPPPIPPLPSFNPILEKKKIAAPPPPERGIKNSTNG